MIKEFCELIKDNERMKNKKEEYKNRLAWRRIFIEKGDVPCPECGGSGFRLYSSTATWHGGCGGDMITDDICDKCWGSGNAEKPWLNLRKLDDFRGGR